MARHDEWETPQELFDKLNGVFNFDLDAFAWGGNQKCEPYFQAAGYDDIWTFGKRVWANPPYSKLPKSVKQCHTQTTIPEFQDRIVVMLIPAYTDTKYWHDIVFKHAKQIVFLKGRLKFWENGVEGKHPARFPSAIVVFGDVADSGIAVWDWKKDPYPFGGPS